MQSKESLAKLYREFGDRWEIEQIQPGTRWIAVHRESVDNEVGLVVANGVGTLRYLMSQTEQEEPADQ